MGVSYETDPQNPLQWFREQLAAINRRFDGLEAAGRTSSGRGGTVVPNASGATLASTLNLAANATLDPSSVITRRSGLVDLHVKLSLSAAFAQYSRLFTIPAGFRPFAVGATTGNWEMHATQYTTANGWQASGIFINTADLSVNTLVGALASGSLIEVHLGWRATA